MSFTGQNQAEADHVPGAFPSEDEVMGASEQNAHNPSQDPAISGRNANTGVDVDDKKTEFLRQQQAAHTAGGRETGIDTTRVEQNENRPESIPSQDKGLSQEQARAGLDTSASGSRTPEAFNTGNEESSIGSDLATMATAVGLAAKDAVLAAKDSAVPAASAATEQAKNLAGYAQENAAPAANYATEQAGNAAAYTRDTVPSGASSGDRDTVSTDNVMGTAGSAAAYAKDTAYTAANTAQSYAPIVLGEPSNTGSSTVRDDASEIATSQAGKSLGTTTNDPTIGDQSQTEKELLGQTNTQETKKPHAGLMSRVKGLEEQLSPESMTPGVVTVLGTENDRSFPLGATDHVIST